MTETQLGICIVLTFAGGLAIGIIIGVQWANWSACRMFDDVMANRKRPDDVKPPNDHAQRTGGA